MHPLSRPENNDAIKVRVVQFIQWPCVMRLGQPVEPQSFTPITAGIRKFANSRVDLASLEQCSCLFGGVYSAVLIHTYCLLEQVPVMKLMSESP